MDSIRTRLIWGLLFGLIVMIALVTLLGDVGQVTRSVIAFQWGWLPVILALTTFNYALRFCKWHYYLGRMGIRNISLAGSARIFLGGFSMTVTPGKIGELLKSVWLKNLTGADIARTAPVVAAERLTDAMACALLASAGVIVYPRYWPAFATILAVLAAGIAVIQIRPLCLWLLGLAERLPLVARFARSLHDLYASTCELLSLKNLAVAVGLGTVSWAGEGVAFFLVLKGLGIPAGPMLLYQAVFILSFSVIVGGASTLPGGLGAAEASLAGMLFVVAGLDRGLAATAALLIRFCTLWFGVTLGALVLLFYRRRLWGEPDQGQPAAGLAPGGNLG